MITMVDKQTIIHLYRSRGYSKRAIARELDLSRKTVHKVIEEYERSLSLDSSSVNLETILTTAPRYDSSKRGRKVITGTVQAIIDDCLAKNASKRASGLKKQFMLKKDIYTLLVSQGFTVSYPSVCKYITGLDTQSPTSGRRLLSDSTILRGRAASSTGVR
jgi:transposase-like protein